MYAIAGLFYTFLNKKQKSIDTQLQSWHTSSTYRNSYDGSSAKAVSMADITSQDQDTPYSKSIFKIQMSFMIYCTAVFHRCRYMWGTIIILAILYSLYLITLFWLRYLTNPTVISLDRNYHEWNTTFPSLTVCFHDRLNVTARDNVIRRVKPANPTKFEQFLNILAETDITNIQQLKGYDEYSSLDINAILNEIVNYVDVPVVLSNDEETNMVRVITELGICYSFNSAINQYLSVNKDENYMARHLIEISIMERDTTASLNNLTSNGNVIFAQNDNGN